MGNPARQYLIPLQHSRKAEPGETAGTRPLSARSFPIRFGRVPELRPRVCACALFPYAVAVVNEVSASNNTLHSLTTGT